MACDVSGVGAPKSVGAFIASRDRDVSAMRRTVPCRTPRSVTEGSNNLVARFVVWLREQPEYKWTFPDDSGGADQIATLEDVVRRLDWTFRYVPRINESRQGPIPPVPGGEPAYPAQTHFSLDDIKRREKNGE